VAHLTTDFAQSNWLGRKMQRACESCTWSLSVGLLVLGILIMATAATLLGVLLYAGWLDGWPSRVIALLLFTTAPIVTYIAWNDYRNPEDSDSLKKRLTWLGVSLAILGVLELGLVVAEFFLLIAIGPPGIF
jgi:FtsH-binding integral membrane protein